MIAANEIRVGNWIKYSDSTDITEYYRGKYVKVDIDNFEDIILDQRYTTIELYTGIPLTPEILEKAEMRWCNEDKYWIDGRCDYVIDEKYNFYLFNEVDGGLWHVKKLKSLHDYQNTVFALTGEELNIQL